MGSIIIRQLATPFGVAELRRRENRRAIQAPRAPRGWSEVSADQDRRGLWRTGTYFKPAA